MIIFVDFWGPGVRRNTGSFVFGEVGVVQAANKVDETPKVCDLVEIGAAQAANKVDETPKVSDLVEIGAV